MQALTAEERELKHEIQALVAELAPALLDEPGLGPASAAQVLLSWSRRGRFRSDGAFARLAGAAPIPASSGRVRRHRLDPGGDRQLNRALHTIIVSRRKNHALTIAYIERKTHEARACARRSAASSATSPATSSACSRQVRWRLDTHRSIPKTCPRT